MRKPIKIIDLFAGPGGLGEGFSQLKENNQNVFKIAVSIEKEESAHRTLTLRSFLRQFDGSSFPPEYYDFLKGELGDSPEQELFKLPKFQNELEEARREAQCITLGEETETRAFKCIDEAIGKENCILIGGPPCQAYSLVGRARNIGSKNYDATQDHRNFLYKEYLKIIARYHPLVFVMENVKGMLSAKVDGELIFGKILNDLQDPCKATDTKPKFIKEKHKYNIYSFVSDKEELTPKDFIIKAEEYGIPQARHRVILLGVREDIDSKTQRHLLEPVEKPPTVKDVIADLPPLRSKLSKGGDSLEKWRNAIKNYDKRLLTEIKNNKDINQAVYNSFLKHISVISDSPESTGKNLNQQKTKAFKDINSELKSWLIDEQLGSYVVNHEARGHITTDLHRYLFYSIYTEVNGVSPKSYNLPKALWPAHKNFDSGKFADRFRVQRANSHGTTVTSHISKDGHYFIHYDPMQCRSLTVREAARIQTFPDNYFFVGNRTQQYVQVGNAVPPFLAFKLAELVFDLLKL
ncbi:DNA (cytosine-5-)-methyltransferase [Paraneptunicella aestuarii]|uniref:DNA cytosine methyltransferase n=1 Tax=Paraneptunicella aestuarii TaxID=2831148 RepID=UPI001E5C9BC0|nr:DNA (cytosine-5-)-methyltransferase [Paraneptunicella aestuarii]UAA39633.1 DNA (cytosine-5-)-methyltransferase [Paraneptunicella aestuarii]